MNGGVGLAPASPGRICPKYLEGIRQMLGSVPAIESGAVARIGELCTHHQQTHSHGGSPLVETDGRRPGGRIAMGQRPRD